MGSASRTVRASAEAACSARATAASMSVSIERRTRKCVWTHVLGHTAAICESISQLGAQSGWGFHNAWVRHAHSASEWRYANWSFRGTQKWVPQSGPKVATPPPEQYFSLGGSCRQKWAQNGYPKVGTKTGSSFGTLTGGIFGSSSMRRLLLPQYNSR